MPPVNDLAANAITLSLPNDVENSTTVGSVTGGPWDNSYPNVWYRVAPTENIAIRFSITKTGGAANLIANADVYRATADPPTSWSNLPDWVGWAEEGLPKSIPLQGGEVYYIDVYGSSGYPDYINGEINFTLTIEPGSVPPNDNVANATIITGGETILTGTTIDATAEAGESADESVWYKIVLGGPGMLKVTIEGLNGFIPGGTFRWKSSTRGSVTSYSELDKEDYFSDIGDGTTSPPTLVYVSDAPYGMFPFQAGDVIYLQIYPYFYQLGDFKITFYVPPKEKCLKAIDYLGSSSTASIVGDAVREAQVYNASWGSLPVRPWESWFGDLEDTLSIPGEDITSIPGFFAVTIKTKNAGTSQPFVGMKRNGQPLMPGAELDSSPDSTPYVDYLTMPAGSIKPNDLDMVRYLPVKPGDTIEIAVSCYIGRGPVDIVSVCFQQILYAVDGTAYDILDVPDYPLGTTSADMRTNAQQGDLIVGKDTAPTFTTHRIPGADMCVTDDGTLWVCHMQQNGGSGATVTGPILHKWNGSSWILISNDVEGLGVKRATPNVNTLLGPYTISMDTDGEDIWMVYHVDDGPATYGSGRKAALRVKKYDVSSGTFSNIGNKFHGTNSDVGGSASMPYQYTRPDCGMYGDCPTIRVSPNGVPWVGFVDYEAPEGYENYAPAYAYMPYAARWTGSIWDIHRLPLRSEFTEPTYQIYKARDHRVLSGTTSVETYLGETAVKETQTAYNNNTCTVTPPAGKWLVGLKIARNYISGPASGFKWKWYKNGVEFSPTEGIVYDSTNDLGWSIYTYGAPEKYTIFNGTTDTISVRLIKTGSAVQDIYIDEIILTPAEVYVQSDGFGINVNYVDDGQPHVGLFMHQVGDVGFGENPGALYQLSFTVPNLDNPTGDGYWAPDNEGNDSWNYQTWIYAEWNGSQWVRKWQKIVEDDAPNHLYVRTRTDSMASTPPLGHFQQGFSFTTDGKDNYMTANMGGGQAFGFFPDQIVALKIGETGFIPFTDGPPGGLASYGYPQYDDGTGTWGQYSWIWLTSGRSICVDVNGNVWVGFPSVGGAPAEYTTMVAHAAKNGLGDWFTASLTNDELGYDAINGPQPHICTSPDGTKLYMLWDVFIYDDGGVTPISETFGVWECDIIPNAKIPLIPTKPLNLSKIKFRAYQEGDPIE